MRCLDRLGMTGLRGHFGRPFTVVISSPPSLSSRACREISFLSILFSLTPRAKKVAKKHSPIQGLPPGEGCKRESRTTDDSRAFLASRDTRYSFLHPCCRRPLERDSQVRDGIFVGWRMVYPFNPNNPCSFCHLEPPIVVLPPRPPSKGDANGSRGRPTTPVPFWYRGTRDILSYIPACAVPWKGTHRFAMAFLSAGA